MPFDQYFPRNFNTNEIQAYAPATSGVYGISNGRQWILIGETDNIRGTLLAHLQESGPASTLMQHQPTGFVFEVCEHARRQSRQDRLVLEYEPACNRQSQQRRSA